MEAFIASIRTLIDNVGSSRSVRLGWEQRDEDGVFTYYREGKVCECILSDWLPMTSPVLVGVPRIQAVWSNDSTGENAN